MSVSDRCTELTCPSHGEANRLLRDRDAETERLTANAEHWEREYDDACQKYARLRQGIWALVSPEAGMGTSPFGDGYRYFAERDLRALLAPEGRTGDE